MSEFVLCLSMTLVIVVNNCIWQHLGYKRGRISVFKEFQRFNAEMNLLHSELNHLFNKPKDEQTKFVDDADRRMNDPENWWRDPK